MDVQARIDQLCAALEGKARAILLSKPENIRYYSGYTGEGYLLIVSGSAVVVTDFRYTEQAELQAPLARVSMTREDHKAHDVLREELSGIDRLLVEDDHMTRRAWMGLAEKLGGIELLGAENLPEGPRKRKSAGEIEAMAMAEAVADRAFEQILGFIKPGVTERETADELERIMRAEGSEGPAFATIVAGGPNGSLPHAIPGERAFQAGDMITMDYGAKVRGMCGDFTRTVALGQPNAEMRRVYHVVREAQLLALDAARPGANCADVDRVARAHIEEAGYGKFFGHGLGHGVGLLVHEAPRLGKTSDKILEAGHVTTVEPGVYLPGIGGVRIEDMIVITEDGHRNLTKSTKDLIIL